MGKNWIPLESNPEVINEYIRKLGVSTSKYAFTDIFGLDPELLAMVPRPVLAVIMCFPITADTERRSKEEDEEAAAAAAPLPSNLFFMKQTVGNACGTIAVLHAIANNIHLMPPEQGSFLQQWLSAAQHMSPQQRAHFLEDPPPDAPNIERAHQAAAAGGASRAPGAEEEVSLHFVAFVHREGRLWQLDGRRGAPVCLGPSSAEHLVEDVVPAVRAFMAHAADSINFNLMALSAAEQ